MFKVLCACPVPVKEYDKTPIPLEVLSLIALSEKEKYFDELQIWYDNEAPDPILVGIKAGANSWEKDIWLLARWGAEKVGFEYLEAEAVKRLTATITSKAKEVKAKAEGILRDTKQEALNHLDNGSTIYYG
jgi:hypothetical protein